MIALIASNISAQIKDMFYHAYGNYMDRAFPADELKVSHSIKYAKLRALIFSYNSLLVVNQENVEKTEEV